MIDLLGAYMKSTYQGGLYKGPPVPVDTSKSDKSQNEMSILNAIMSMVGGNQAPAGTTTVGGKSYSPAYGRTGGYGYTGSSAPAGTTTVGNKSYSPVYGKTGGYG